MPPTVLAPTVFSTVGLPAARRIELWEAHNANALIGLDVRATEALEATELNVQLPQVQLARVAGTAHVVERTAEVIDRGPADAVLNGQAGSALLDTYSTERAPVAKQIVTRANQSSREFVQFFEVLGLTEAETEEEMREQIEERKANYEFNAHGVELGQFYTSTAIVGDGSSRPEPTRDPELYYQASTVPGSHLPHVWVGDAASKVSTLDLAPYTRFTLITGIAGEAWADAAAKVAKDLRIPLETVIIGPGREVTDIYYDWARVREVDEDGVLLVRPDKHIGWRSMTMPEDPERALRSVLASLLSRN